MSLSFHLRSLVPARSTWTKRLARRGRVKREETRSLRYRRKKESEIMHVIRKMCSGRGRDKGMHFSARRRGSGSSHAARSPFVEGNDSSARKRNSRGSTGRRPFHQRAGRNAPMINHLLVANSSTKFAWRFATATWWRPRRDAGETRDAPGAETLIPLV